MALSNERLATLELPEPLAEAVREAKRLKSFGAQRRQAQYIGRLMRDIDPAPIRAPHRRLGGQLADARGLAAGPRTLARTSAQRCAGADRSRANISGGRSSAASHPGAQRSRRDSDGQAAAALPRALSGAEGTACRSPLPTPKHRADGRIHCSWLYSPEPVHAPTMSNARDDTLLLGLVSISDRASLGIYEDAGMPALEDWFTRTLTTPFRVEKRLIPDEQAVIEATLKELVDDDRLRPRADHRRHRSCGARRHPGGNARGRRQGHARFRRADAPGQPQVRADRDPVSAGRRHPQAVTDSQPARAAESHQGNAGRREGRRRAKQLVPGIFAAVPYCLDLIGGPYVETRDEVIKVFRPKSALRPPKA